MAKLRNESLKAFAERMSKVEKLEEFHVGRACRGNSRAVFSFEGNICYLESRGFANYSSLTLPAIGKALLITLNSPNAWWWTDFMVYGKTRAKQIAKHYHGDIREAPYAKVDDKWFYFVFDEFDDLMKMVHDRHTGCFVEKWGKEKAVYENCF